VFFSSADDIQNITIPLRLWGIERLNKKAALRTHYFNFPTGCNSNYPAKKFSSKLTVSVSTPDEKNGQPISEINSQKQNIFLSNSECPPGGEHHEWSGYLY
jgi:hypothetical protein